MKKISLMVLVSFIMLIYLSTDVLAYLDPGTGGAIVGSLWPLILIFFSTIGAFFVKRFWKPIKRLFSKSQGTIEHTKNNR